jgi:hypothetical protein
MKEIPINLSDDETARLLDKIKVCGECWEWQAYVRADGYGEIRIRQVGYLAHRVLFTLSNGRIGQTLELDHLCRNRKCVRPSHLEAVSTRENALRGDGAAGINARKTHCPVGHLLVGANLILERNGRGRKCRACHNDRCIRRGRRIKALTGKYYVPPCRRKK